MNMNMIQTQKYDWPLNSTLHNPRDVASTKGSSAIVQVFKSQQLDTSLLAVKVQIKKYMTICQQPKIITDNVISNKAIDRGTKLLRAISDNRKYMGFPQPRQSSV